MPSLIQEELDMAVWLAENTDLTTREIPYEVRRRLMEGSDVSDHVREHLEDGHVHAHSAYYGYTPYAKAIKDRKKGRTKVVRGVVETRGLTKTFPELEPKLREIAEIELEIRKKEALDRLGKVEDELFEKSEKKRVMELQIVGLSERLRNAHATIRSLEGQKRGLEPYPQRYRGERAKREFMHGLLNTCASEYFRARGEERRAKRILLWDEYEGLAPDDFKPFFAGIGRSAGEAKRRLMLLDNAVNKIAELERQIKTLKAIKKEYSQALFDLGTTIWEFFSEWRVAVNNGQLDFYVEGKSEFYRLNVEGREHVRFQAYDTLPSDGVLLRGMLRGFTLGIKKGVEERIEDELRTLQTKIAEQVGRVGKLGEELEEEGEKREKVESAFPKIIRSWEQYKKSEDYDLKVPKLYTVSGLNVLLKPDETMEIIDEESLEAKKKELEIERLGAIERIEKGIEEKIPNPLHKWLLSQKELSKELSFDEYCDVAIRLLAKHIDT